MAIIACYGCRVCDDQSMWAGLLSDALLMYPFNYLKAIFECNGYHDDENQE